MVNLTIKFSDRVDKDLIGLLKSQNIKYSKMVMGAIYAYLTKAPISSVLPLEQREVDYTQKGFRVHIAVSESSKGKWLPREAYAAIDHYITDIPKGLAAIYIKGIMRSMFADLMYGESMELALAIPRPRYNVPVYRPVVKNVMNVTPQNEGLLSQEAVTETPVPVKSVETVEQTKPVTPVVAETPKEITESKPVSDVNPSSEKVGTERNNSESGITFSDDLCEPFEYEAEKTETGVSETQGTQELPEGLFAAFENLLDN